MKLKWLIPLAAGLSVLQSSCVQHITGKSDRYRFNQILNIHYTPNDSTRCYGCYTDAGSWMGFTIPDEIDPVNGFCGPFSIDKRYFMAKSVVTPFLKNAGSASFVIDSTDYFPGELLMKSQVGDHKLEQRLWFIDANTALLNIRTDSHEALSFTGESWSPLVELSQIGRAHV